MLEVGKVRSDLSLPSFLIFLRFPLFDTISCLSSRQAACFRNNVENGDGTSFASGQIKFQRADALIPTYERERVNSIARTSDETWNTHARTHACTRTRIRRIIPDAPACIIRDVLGDFVILARREKERERRCAENPRRLWGTKARRISRCSKNLRAFVRLQPRALLRCIRDTSIVLSRIDKSRIVRYDENVIYIKLKIRPFSN